MDFQLSRLFQNNYEIIGRYSFQNRNQDMPISVLSNKQYSFGLTRYIWEHALKLQAEITYDVRETRFFNNPKTDSWYLRFQVEMGI